VTWTLKAFYACFEAWLLHKLPASSLKPF